MPAPSARGSSTGSRRRRWPSHATCLCHPDPICAGRKGRQQNEEMSHMGANQYGAVGAWVSAVLVGGSLMLAPMPNGAAQAAEAPQPPQSDAAEADPIATHLERGQAYLDKGEYARLCSSSSRSCASTTCPRISMSRPRSMPGRRGTIRPVGACPVSAMRRPAAAITGKMSPGPPMPRAATRPAIGSGRPAVGGGLSYILSDDVSVEGDLDYRFRYYDDTERRDDSDLRWNAGSPSPSPRQPGHGGAGPGELSGPRGLSPRLWPLRQSGLRPRRPETGSP